MVARRQLERLRLIGLSFAAISIAFACSNPRQNEARTRPAPLRDRDAIAYTLSHQSARHLPPFPFSPQTPVGGCYTLSPAV
jgi:hypothetical protein